MNPNGCTIIAASGAGLRLVSEEVHGEGLEFLLSLPSSTSQKNFAKQVLSIRWIEGRCMAKAARLSALGLLGLLCVLSIYIDLSGPWQGSLIGLLVINLPIYMLPTIVAGYRDHSNMAAIAILNLLLGWTGLGWLAALAWSFARLSSLSLPSSLH